MAQLYTIENQEIKVTITDQGAEMISLIGKADNTEYLWQGDPTYWTGHAYNLFPICGRLTEGKYTYRGNTYEMNLHGFFRKSHVDMHEQGADFISFRMVDSEATRKIYPFGFDFTLTYTLVENTVVTTFDITNTGDNDLIFAVGGHPGFNLPMGGEGVFEDYYLEFANPCTPNQIEISPRGLFTGKKTAYSLKDGNVLPLSHKLFEIDGIFLSRMDSTVTLKSNKSARAVTLEYPDMPYLGVWHPSACKAPFVCIEPWCGLPGYDGEMEDIITRHDTFHVLPGKVQAVQFKMTFH